MGEFAGILVILQESHLPQHHNVTSSKEVVMMESKYIPMALVNTTMCLDSQNDSCKWCFFTLY